MATDNYHLTNVNKRDKILEGVDAAVYSIAGFRNRRKSRIKKLLSLADSVCELSKKWEESSEEQLSKELNELAAIFKRRKKNYINSIPRALAALREAAFRSTGLRPYKVQIAGAAAMHKGFIAEMETGEGKTLTAALAAVINGWSGLPCHILTANDYLAQRDAEKLEPFYSYCGVTVGSVSGEQQPPERKAGYDCNITYTTAKEVCADFLRDRLAMGTEQTANKRLLKQLFPELSKQSSMTVMRGVHTAIIDEADSILIDEAVTPLIISRNSENDPFTQACIAANEVIKKLKLDEHYTVDKQYKDIKLNPDLDLEDLSKGLDIPKQFKGAGFQRELTRQALMAREFFHKDKQYVIQDDKIVIVDDFTGRIMPQRSWSDGLHQLVEAKEGVPITPPNETLARLSFQRFFRYYHQLSGMTGTASEAASELWHIYELPVIKIPRNRPCMRVLEHPTYSKNKEEKWKAIISKTSYEHKKGRPVLIGTRSVETSEKLASMLKDIGLSCNLINAVRHEEEADIVNKAGNAGAITVATNMAGRGTDISITKDIHNNGGLCVISAELNESARIDRQLYGRSARQGDNGSATSFISLDDPLFMRFLPTFVSKPLQSSPKTDGFFWRNLITQGVNLSQNIAQKRAYKNRKAVQKTDLWIEDSLSFVTDDIVT